MKLGSTHRWLIVAMAALLLVTTVVMGAQAQPDTATVGSVQWVTYVDPRFDFSIKYPSNWQVIPRDDSTGVGATLSFLVEPTDSTGNDLHDAMMKVEVGMYLVPWSDRTSLSDRSLKSWVRHYNQVSKVPGSEVVKEDARYIRVDGKRALYEKGNGFSPYAYVSVPRGDIVWFIWSNASEAEELSYFRSMVNSFEFGGATPMTLQEALGSEFQPSRLIKGLSDSGGPLGANGSVLPAVSSLWKSPLRGSNLTATCNAATHGPHYGGTNQGKSEYAIDVAGAGIVEWVTQVYASRQGTITFAGYNTSGFGNLVKLERDGLTAFTAHLAGIHESIYAGKYVNVGTLLGWVGKSGNATGVHLHFEIRDTSPHSVSLIGLTGFTAGTYPYPGAPGTGICGSITY